MRQPSLCPLGVRGKPYYDSEMYEEMACTLNDDQTKSMCNSSNLTLS